MDNSGKSVTPTQTPSSYHTYHQITPNPNYTYKLIQLPTALLAHIKEHDDTDAGDQLIIKASPHVSNDLVMCTQDKTWKMRQMNHSNTVLIVNNMNINSLQHSVEPVVATEKNKDVPNKLLGVGSCSSEFELSSTKGFIRTEGLAQYDGQRTEGLAQYDGQRTEELAQYDGQRTEELAQYDGQHNPQGTGIALEQLIEDSLVSTQEFYTKWYQMGGCDVEGTAVLLSHRFITQVLLTLIPVLISNEIQYEEADVDLDEITTLMENRLYNKQVLTTILHKFGSPVPSTSCFKLDNLAISKWFGVQTLVSHASMRSISSQQLLIDWKACLPPFYSVPIDLAYLRGHYCRPLKDQIQYLNPHNLSDHDLGARIKDMFKVVKEWDYDEFVPYIEHLIPSNKKPDTLILKYARKKRVGKNRFVVCGR